MLTATLAVIFSLMPSNADPLPGAKRVLILGDSITAAGMYIAYLDSYFTTRYPDREIEFINLGLPSETISGQSEPTHPWPRPNVHERLDRALTVLKPDVVIACYGMNDGIYHPFADERLNAFKDGIEKLISRCRKDSIPLCLLTAPPFDADAIRAKLKPAGSTDFSWMTPYDKYQDDVLAKYAAWELTRAGKDVTVIDIQTPLMEAVTRQRRDLKRPNYQLAGDGVHMNADGHWPIAAAILKKWNCTLDSDEAQIDATSQRASRGDIKNIRREAGGVRFSWTTQLPVPEDPAWTEAMREAKTLPVHRLRIAGLRDGQYTLYEGSQAVGMVDVKDGAAAMDLRKFVELSSNRRADELGELIRKRERIMSPSWRDHVGHKRPDTEKGLPLDEAKKQAEPLTAEIRRLRRPVTLDLSLRAN